MNNKFYTGAIPGGEGLTFRGDLPPVNKNKYPKWFNTATGHTLTWYEDADDTGQWVQDNPTGRALGSIPANKNYIINPIFNINQRTFAGGNLNAGVYGVDRWKAFNAAATLNISDIEATIVGDIGQIVEDMGYVGNMTLSWKGTATAQGSGETSPFTFYKLPGITAIEFSDGTLSEVKLEIGEVTTPFEYPDLSLELLKCQRYFWKTLASSMMYILNGTATTRYRTMVYPVEMRVTPTLSNLAVVPPASVGTQNPSKAQINVLCSYGNTSTGGTLSTGATFDAEL